MSTREALLSHLWTEIINSHLRPGVLAEMIAGAKTRPDEPFADSGAAVERLLSSGADPQDIRLLMRGTAYAAVFSTLYSIGDPGVDGDDVLMLHEELLMADPTGMEGRPGSAAAAVQLCAQADP